MRAEETKDLAPVKEPSLNTFLAQRRAEEAKHVVPAKESSPVPLDQDFDFGGPAPPKNMPPSDADFDFGGPDPVQAKQ